MKNLLFLFTFFLFANSNTSAKIWRYTSSLSIDTLKKGKNYLLFSKSENVETVSFSKSKKSKENIVYIRFGFPTPIPSSNVANGQIISSKRYKEGGILPIFDKIDIIKGNYADMATAKDTKYRSLFTLSGVQFPLQLKLTSGVETIDLELTEAGEWNMEIELKNN